MSDLEESHVLALKSSILELSAKIGVMVNSVDNLAERVDGVAEDISKIKEAVYNPDIGLYARLAEQAARITTLEQWKESTTKLTWVIISVVTGLVLNQMWDAMFGI
jgi:chromosome segregation ATPase